MRFIANLCGSETVEGRRASAAGAFGQVREESAGLKRSINGNTAGWLSEVAILPDGRHWLLLFVLANLCLGCAPRSGSGTVIGIVGGNGPDATAQFYIGLHAKMAASDLGAHLRPRLVMVDAPMPFLAGGLSDEAVMNKAVDTTREALKALESLEAGVIAVPCNTLQPVVRDVSKDFARLKNVNLIEAAVAAVRSRGWAKVGILAASPFVIDSVYGPAFKLAGIELVRPDMDEQRGINEIVRAVYAGKAGLAERDLLARVVEGLKAKGAQALLIACTDLPSVIQQERYGVPLLDTLEILLQATMQALVPPQ